MGIRNDPEHDRQADRYVAFLDVLGFRELVAHRHFASLVSNYRKCLDSALAPHGVEYVVFSDSVALATASASEEDLKKIILACSHLQYLLLLLEPRPISIRGAISRGATTLELQSKGGIVAGPAIIDAYEYEKRQEWVGIMITPRVRQEAPTFFGWREPTIPSIPEGTRGIPVQNEVQGILESCLPFLLSTHAAMIPFADHARPFEGIAVVPVCPGDHLDTWRPKTYSLLSEKLGRLRSEAPDPRSQSKYRSALKWLGRVSSSRASFAEKITPGTMNMVLQKYRTGLGIQRA